jgi:hypothetical protein
MSALPLLRPSIAAMRKLTSSMMLVKMRRAENETHVLCVSSERKQKDRAIRELHEKRLLADLEKLKKRVTKGMDEVGPHRSAEPGTRPARARRAAADTAGVRAGQPRIRTSIETTSPAYEGRLMKIVSFLILLSIATTIAGAAFAFIDPRIGSALSLAGIGSMLGLLHRAWLVSRDQAMLELIPGRYELALKLSASRLQSRTVLNQFLAETSSLRKP